MEKGWESDERRGRMPKSYRYNNRMDRIRDGRDRLRRCGNTLGHGLATMGMNMRGQSGVYSSFPRLLEVSIPISRSLYPGGGVGHGMRRTGAADIRS